MPFSAIFYAPGSRKLHIENCKILNLMFFPIYLSAYAKNIISFFLKIIQFVKFSKLVCFKIIAKFSNLSLRKSYWGLELKFSYMHFFTFFSYRIQNEELKNKFSYHWSVCPHLANLILKLIKKFWQKNVKFWI
jgi:hypothetical protein